MQPSEPLEPPTILPLCTINIKFADQVQR